MNENGPEPAAKLTIGSIDVPTAKYTVVAHYNPKDIDLAHQSSWAEEGSVKGMTDNKRDHINDIQYTGAPARTMSLELFLDYYEAPYAVDRQSIDTVIGILSELASPRDEHSTDPQMRRPHICIVAWGQRGVPAFRCVIESLAVKYTMFSRDGVPVRAVCNLKLKEARLSKALRSRELPDLLRYLVD